MKGLSYDIMSIDVIYVAGEIVLPHHGVSPAMKGLSYDIMSIDVKTCNIEGSNKLI